MSERRKVDGITHRAVVLVRPVEQALVHVKEASKRRLVMSKRYLIFGSLALQIFNFVPMIAMATFENGTADYEVGQTDANGDPDFTKGSSAASINNVGLNPNQNDTPGHMAMDTVRHRLYVPDTRNNRVVIYNLDSSNVLIDSIQDGVLGQRDLFHDTTQEDSPAQNSLWLPAAVSVDASGNVWIADSGNHRVVRYPVPVGDGTDMADRLLGQATYTLNLRNRGISSGTSASALRLPQGVSADSGGVWVADTDNLRLIYFPNPTGDGSDAATKVLGEPNLTAVNVLSGHDDPPGTPAGQRTGHALLYPKSIVQVGADIWATSFYGVVRYQSPVGDGTDNYNLIFGNDLPDFGRNSPGPAPNALISPVDLAYDASHNRMYISDYSNNRVVGYTIPASGNGTASIADRLIGQPNYASAIFYDEANGHTPSASTLSGPTGLIANGSTLYVLDSNNARVLSFNDPGVSTNTATHVLGHMTNNQPDFNSGFANDALRAGLVLPISIAVDTNRHILYCAELQTNRIVMYNLDDDNKVTDQIPDGVIGQPNFQSSAINRGGGMTPAANTLSEPAGLVIGTDGDLLVADANNNRVLRFPTPVGDGSDTANQVIGQPDFTSADPNRGSTPSAQGLSTPLGVALDPDNNIWVTDAGNNRVLRFAPPAGNGTTAAANRVLGQADFISADDNRGDDDPTAATLALPTEITFSHAGELWLTDTANCRVLGYSASIASDGQAATKVLGQPDMTTDTIPAFDLSDLSDHNIPFPFGLAFDQGDKLWVADGGGNRLLRFSNIRGDGTDVADKVVGQADFTSGQPNRDGQPSASTLSLPRSMVFAGHYVYVDDLANSRIMMYSTQPIDPSVTIEYNGQQASLFEQARDWLVPAAEASSGTAVTLHLSAIGATEMMVSNRSDFAGAAWEPYVTAKSWTLAAETGAASVYAKFRNSDHYESTVASSTTQLPNPSAQPAAPSHHQFGFNLSFGQFGNEIRTLQDLLKQIGLFPGYVGSTGFFGVITQTSVRIFQAFMHLPTTGFFGPLTRQALNTYTTATNPPPLIGRFNLGYGSRGGSVSALQTTLKQAGYFPRSVAATGYFGPITQAAVRQLQYHYLGFSTGFVGIWTIMILTFLFH